MYSPVARSRGKKQMQKIKRGSKCYMRVTNKKKKKSFSNILVYCSDLSVFMPRLGDILTDAFANLKEVAGKPQK